MLVTSMVILAVKNKNFLCTFEQIYGQYGDCVGKVDGYFQLEVGVCVCVCVCVCVFWGLE